MAALDAIFSDLGKLVAPEDVAVINTSGQQHGHVYLNDEAPSIFARLQNNGAEQQDLTTLLKGSPGLRPGPHLDDLEYGGAGGLHQERSRGQREADQALRVGRPVAVHRHCRQTDRRAISRAYADTRTIQLLSSFVPAVLTGNARVPADFGNACGMSLMNYRRKQWSRALIGAVSRGCREASGLSDRSFPASSRPMLS